MDKILFNDMLKCVEEMLIRVIDYYIIKDKSPHKTAKKSGTSVKKPRGRRNNIPHYRTDEGLADINTYIKNNPHVTSAELCEKFNIPRGSFNSIRSKLKGLKTQRKGRRPKEITDLIPKKPEPGIIRVTKDLMHKIAVYYHDNPKMDLSELAEDFGVSAKVVNHVIDNIEKYITIDTLPNNQSPGPVSMGSDKVNKDV